MVAWAGGWTPLRSGNPYITHQVAALTLTWKVLRISLSVIARTVGFTYCGRDWFSSPRWFVLMVLGFSLIPFSSKRFFQKLRWIGDY
jgi:hypothetical protein